MRWQGWQHGHGVDLCPRVEQLVGDPARQARFFAGFSGWGPGQLENEMTEDSWLLLPADARSAYDLPALYADAATHARSPALQSSRWLRERYGHLAPRGGGARRQPSTTMGQRGAKAQPASPAAEPTLPGISVRRSAR